jgi:hypothetical protein
MGDLLQEALDRLGSQRRRALVDVLMQARNRAADEDPALASVWEAFAATTHFVERTEAARLSALDPDVQAWRETLLYEGDEDADAG